MFVKCVKQQQKQKFSKHTDTLTYAKQAKKNSLVVLKGKLKCKTHIKLKF